jgi:hypothetical protein
MPGTEASDRPFDESPGRDLRSGEEQAHVTSAPAARGGSSEGRGLRRMLLLVAAGLVGAALFLPLWGMTLVSVQYPEGLRMVVYPLKLVGDLTEINMLNGYIGMADISREYFVELSLIPILFGSIAALLVVAAFIDRIWATLLPLVALGATATYGLWSMSRRLYEYGHVLDPMAPMDVAPFTPPMIGENQIAQFGTYAWFGWGTVLPAGAAGLLVLALWLDWRRRGRREATR